MTVSLKKFKVFVRKRIKKPTFLQTLSTAPISIRSRIIREYRKYKLKEKLIVLQRVESASGLTVTYLLAYV